MEISPDQHNPDDEDLELTVTEAEETLTDWDPWGDPGLSIAVFGHRPSSPLFAVSLDALQDMRGHGAAEPQREVGGVLLGSFVRTPDGPLTRIEDIVIADTTDASLTHVTFTHESWRRIHEQLDVREDSARIVGWYHTHPGFGPFLSGQDLFIQRHFFSNPLHAALVLDPVRQLFAVFGWAEGEIAKVQGCFAYSQRAQDAELLALTNEFHYAVEQPKGAFASLKTLLTRDIGR